MNSIPRCKGETSPRWYEHKARPCKLPAWQDGWCRKHHPARRALSGTPAGQIVAARKSLASAEKKVAHWQRKIVGLEAEQKRWMAFNQQNT